MEAEYIALSTDMRDSLPMLSLLNDLEEIRHITRDPKSTVPTAEVCVLCTDSYRVGNLSSPTMGKQSFCSLRVVPFKCSLNTLSNEIIFTDSLQSAKDQGGEELQEGADDQEAGVITPDQSKV